MFEDLAKKLTGFGFTAIKKTGEVAEIASLKTKVIAKKKNIQDHYAELGRAFYEAHKEDAEEFASQINEITALFEEIDKLEKDMEELKVNLDTTGSEKETETENETAEEEAADVEDVKEENFVGEVVEDSEEVVSDALEEDAVTETERKEIEEPAQTEETIPENNTEDTCEGEVPEKTDEKLSGDGAQTSEVPVEAVEQQVN